jgi:hypothetical protein
VTVFGGAVLLKPAETAESHARQQLAQLIRVGGKLAVLGVEDGRRAMGWWHVCKPGSWTPPQAVALHGDAEGRDLAYGRSLCGRVVVTNGYCSDWRPPAGVLCPACSEQL